MTEPGEVRQKVNQARKLLAQGKAAQAKAILKGIDHPKAKSLLAQIDAQVGQQVTKRGSFPILPVLGLLLVVTGVVLSALIMSAAGRGAGEPPVVLPTLVPTPDCTNAMVQAWWAQQNIMLDSFMADASAASRTMPGERLTGQLASLHQMRSGVPDLPTCASLEMQGSVTELLSAMDGVISVLDRWSNGEIDGTQLTNELYAVQQAFSEGRRLVASKIATE